MVKTSFFTSVVVAASLAHTAVHAYTWDTIAAFALPAYITNHYMSKRTIEDMRTHAEWIVDAYENHHIYIKIEEITAAYRIVNSTDEQLKNRMWWENTCVSVVAGVVAAALYHSRMYPSKDPVRHCCHCKAAV